MARLSATWLAHTDLRLVLFRGALVPTVRAAPYPLQARPMRDYPAPDDALRLRGVVIDCCLRNCMAWCVVAGPQQLPTCGVRRPPPYRALRRRIFFKPAPCATTLRPMRRFASVGLLVTTTCAMAQLGASWLTHNSFRGVRVGGGLSPLRRRIHLKPAPCAITLRPMIRCASVGM